MGMAGMSGPRRLRGLILGILLGIPALSGFSQTPDEPLSLSYTLTEYQWGALPLVPGDLEPLFKPLLTTLMTELLGGWEGLPDHQLEAEELDALRKKAWETRIGQEKKALADALGARDALIFKAGGATEADYRTAKEKIDKIRASLARWEAFDSKSVTGPEKAPLKRVSESPEKPLLTPGTGDWKAWAEGKGLQMVLQGTLSSRQGYLFCRLEAKTPRGVVATWESWFSPEESVSMMNQARLALTPALLGRPSAALVLKVTPSQGEIYLDGTLLGVGVVNEPYLEPGDYLVNVEAQGYLPQSFTITLEEGKTTTVEKTLEKAAEDLVSLQTLPEGADVWMDSFWVGKTPLEVSRPGARTLVQFFFPEYEESSLTLGPGVVPPPAIPLIPQGKRTTLLEAKDRFYLSLAVFSISFAATALLRSQETPLAGLWVDYGLAYQNGTGTKADADFAYTLYEISRNGGWAGIGVSALSFGWVLWELFGYLSTGESELYQ